MNKKEFQETVRYYLGEGLLKKAKESRGPRECVHCGKKGKDVYWDVDPYNQDINGDDTKMWICNKCAKESADDI